ncbi:MAG: RidA family protein [Propionibacteriaceae bacterium]|nr:RidA family protein [Propionibacteriaceae bacterium]
MTMSSNARERLQEWGLALPAVPTPVGSYVPALRVGTLAHTSGQLPLVDGALASTGALTSADDVPRGAAAARVAALNAVAALADVLGGLDRIARIVKVTVFVASAPGFTQQPAVANGASDLLTALFGDAGRHVRSAVGVAALPMDAPVEVEVTCEVAA